MGEKKSQAAGKTLQKNENSAIISDNSAADGRGASRMKRENYITWDEYFMGVAMLLSVPLRPLLEKIPAWAGAVGCFLLFLFLPR